MNILIIGGSRFIGPHIIKELMKKNHTITVFNRGLIKNKYPRIIKYIKGDRNDGFNIKDHFDVVIDTCAYNGLQTKKLIQELNFDFLIHISTVASYKKSYIFPLNEKKSPLGPWPLWMEYNKGKIECEKLLMNSEIKSAIIRPVYVLGSHNHCDREHFIYSKIKKREPLLLPGNGEAVVQFVFVQDIAKIIAHLAENKITGIFNCCGDEMITLKGLVEEMGKIINIKPIIKFNSKTDGDQFNIKEFPFANENIICSNEKIKKIGINYTPLLQGLKDDY